ncbi:MULTISPECIES: Crp/Fnr family transcriptional regulator [Paenibacillus]|uniref:Crp/Fnr family transcriptional regulator n=1 Tax=Paenibacillus radicis (ex Xue et al. 2023) TaxID=2972489 RepID=A0ABT1YUT2_9BACL|nr:Crp/Fnr family transcriptional regulator [Paenibacillus radicis (ex Xue et al. 2023)]MCR8636360.1 Crp/Fnr family transcriptional regulator [Paenibacillus radicis (ex Xue et al. 2023)]
MRNLVPLLQNVPIFQDLTTGELEAIAPLFVERTFKKGTILFFEADLGDEFFLIESGVVKIYRIDYAKEIILALFRDGDFFGEMSLIQKGLTRSATAETLETSTIYTLVRSEFYQFLERTPKLSLRLLEATMERLRKANEQIYDLTFLDVRMRIIKVVHRLAEEHGVIKQGNLMINMKLTHQQLANLAGTVRESVTKVLQELQEDQIITIQKKMIYINNLEAMRKLFPPPTS